MPVAKVQWYSTIKNYGFLQIGPEENLFVHRTAITFGKEGFKKLMPGQTVEYDLGTNAGKPCATNVRLPEVAGVADVESTL
jgi:cold shock CspA family protein